MIEGDAISTGSRVWGVGALCRAVADALDARFNPVMVRGEIASFSRAASGHCYFSLKDDSGQIRCAMFRRAAMLLDFPVKEGDLVEVRGRLGVYEARGDLQLIVETMAQAGKGAWFEQFLRTKAKLEAQGLFDASRKRPLPVMPRGIGVVTSLGAAALHDVVTALQRRVPHIPVLVSPAMVQGPTAPIELAAALRNLYALCETGDERPEGPPVIDVILLVRGGGSAEDLWAFNDEALAREIAVSPVPVICGIGHETDFTIADFVADLRAPTPTAAAELVSQSRAVLWAETLAIGRRMREVLVRRLDSQAQRLDMNASRLGRPSTRLSVCKASLAAMEQGLRFAAALTVQRHTQSVHGAAVALESCRRSALEMQAARLDRAAVRLGLLDPKRVLARGYAWLSSPNGEPASSVSQLHEGNKVHATLVDGGVELTVNRRLA